MWIGYYLLSSLSNIAVTICTETDWEVVMAADVVHAMERPSAVIATLCWPTHKRTSLHAAITSKEQGHVTMLQVLKPGDMPRYGHVAKDQHVLFLADLDCPNIAENLRDIGANAYFQSPYRWLLIKGYNNETDEQTSSIPSALEDIEVLIDSEVIVVQPSSMSSYNLYFVYKISATTNWQTETYGSWDTHNRFRKTNQHGSIASRRLDLQGQTVSVCFVATNNDSITHLTDGINDHIDTITKASVLTVGHLLELLNASQKIVFADSWGYKINGSWTGLAGHLIRKEVELGGSPMFITTPRSLELDFVASPTPTKISFVFRQPKLSYTSNLYLLSFKTTVWYSLLGLVFLMFLALLAVATWEWERSRDDRNLSTDARILRGNVRDVALLVLGAACQQGSPVELRGGLGRAVMFVLFLTLMFLYTSYAANIVALLQSSSSQINTLEDLLHSRIKLGAEDIVYNRYYFSTATEPVRKAIYETKIAPVKSKPNFLSMEEGVKKMQKGLYAFNMETGVGYKFVSKYFRESEKCGLTEISYLQVVDPWQAVQKNSHFKEIFKIGLQRIKERGLQARENLRLYEKRPKCSGSESHFISVSMVDCYPALLVLVYGVIFALLFLFMEIIVDNRRGIVNKVCINTRRR